MSQNYKIDTYFNENLTSGAILWVSFEIGRLNHRGRIEGRVEERYLSEVRGGKKELFSCWKRVEPCKVECSIASHGTFNLD